MARDVYIVVRTGKDADPDIGGVEIVAVYDDAAAANERLFDIVRDNLWHADQSDVSEMSQTTIWTFLNPCASDDARYDAAQELYEALCGENEAIAVFVQHIAG